MLRYFEEMCLIMQEKALRCIQITGVPDIFGPMKSLSSGFVTYFHVINVLKGLIVGPVSACL